MSQPVEEKLSEEYERVFIIEYASKGINFIIGGIYLKSDKACNFKEGDRVIFTKATPYKCAGSEFRSVISNLTCSVTCL